jgi:glycosyltransferase involved in cell wall biosynthesis
MKVICLINTRNHSQFIDECVRSCLEQLIPLDCIYEVHAIDAGSTDDTLEKLKTYHDRITLHPRENIGQSGAFNLCLELDADIFMFCDGDDRLHQDRLRQIVAVFRKYPDVVMVGNSINEVDAAGNLIRRVYVEKDQCLDASGSDAERLYGVRCLLGTSRLSVHKNALVKILPIEHIILFEADEYIFNLLPSFGPVCILKEGLTDYRLHGSNNYQSNNPSLERTKRYRLVHEELLVSMIAMRDKRGMTGRYIGLCEKGLRATCEQALSLEEAMQSRTRAVNLILRASRALGLVKASKAKRFLYSLMVVVFGLPTSLSVHSFLRGLLSRFLSITSRVPDARLL